MSIEVNREKVVFGNRLEENCTYQDINPSFSLSGTGKNNNRIIFSIGQNVLSRHLLLLGGIGTGKTNLCNHLIKDIRKTLTDDDVMIIFDTKGDYYSSFYEKGDIVISNDNRSTGSVKIDYWNIFNEINKEKSEDEILEIANALFSEKIEKTTQQFFPLAAKDLFAALMIHLMRDDKRKDKLNNQALRHYWDTMTPSILLKILSRHDDLKAMTSYILDEKSGQTLGVISELQQVVREIFVGNFNKNGGLSIRDIVRNKGKKVVFIEYDLAMGGILTPIFKTIIDLAIKETLSQANGGKGNVYFFIDEFSLLPHLQHIGDGINFGRSLGAKFIVGIQNIDQIKQAYGEFQANSILSGFGTLFSFRVTDRESREFIKNHFGKNIRQRTYMSSMQNKGVIDQIMEGYVIEDEDINNLKIGEAIVSTIAGNPFCMRFDLYKEV